MKRASLTRFDQSTGTKTAFHLNFEDRQEFWNFASTMAYLRSEEEDRLADLSRKLSLVRLFIPSHGPGGPLDAICNNVDHASGMFLASFIVVLLLRIRAHDYGNDQDDITLANDPLSRG